jgi:DNA-directed RNA polymerase specialized sigma24 family protein
MADKGSGARAPADAKLLEQVRSGDTSAFGVLYERHVHAVRRLARELVLSPAEADHLVAETFTLVHDVTQGGGGPADAFRPYLLGALRRVAAGQVGDRRAPAPGDPGPGEVLAPSPDDAHVAHAFPSLPDGTRAALWHTEIDQGAPAEVAPLLGTSPNAVASVRRRARESLRHAVVTSYAARATRPECAATAEHLAGYQRGTLSAGDSGPVADHVSRCGDCTSVVAALGDLTSALREQVAPLYLGSAATAYLVGSRLAAPAGSAAGAGDTREMPVAVGSRPRRSIRRTWVAAGAVLAIGAVAAALALTGNAAPSSAAGHPAADAVPSTPVTTGSGSPAGTPAPARSDRHSRAARPAASVSRGPKPSASVHGAPKSGPSASPKSPRASSPATSSPSPAPGVTLTASVSVQQTFGLTEVSFQVNDVGTAATGTVTATITLPSGSWFIAVIHTHQGADGWSCQPDSTGATCQHSAISAGAQATGTMLIGAGGSACGQPVQLSASSGSAATSAQSAQDIQCGNG